MVAQIVPQVLLYSTLAALTASLGVLPFRWRRQVPRSWVGVSAALASGLMLGAGYLLVSAGLKRNAPRVLLGACLGLLYTFWSQHYAGTRHLELEPPEERGPDYGYRVILQNTLHSASEGVAIGAAMVISLQMGIFMAFALAVHNVGEAMALGEALYSHSLSRPAAGLSVVTNVPQVLLAVVSYSLAPWLGIWQAALLGFAAGAMLFLLLTELLPSCYQRSGRSTVALIVSISAAAVVLLAELLV